MPTRTVSQGFEDFHRRLVPSATESEAAKNHRASIEACLKSNFGLLRFFRSGSFGNGTNIRNYSDVDYFASLPAESVNTVSTKTLNEVASVLRKRFPATYGIRVDAPAVIVPFGFDASETTEVIPARLVYSGGPFVYHIADGSGGWRRSSPEAQNDYIRSVSEKVGGKAKPLVRFLKAWKYYQSVPVSSFYLELVTAKHAAGASPIVYAWDVRDVLQKLSDSGLATVDDPAGQSGKVRACRTESLRTEALSKVRTALNRTVLARKDEENDDIGGAFAWWNMLYDGKFPSYYY